MQAGQVLEVLRRCADRSLDPRLVSEVLEIVVGVLEGERPELERKRPGRKLGRKPGPKAKRRPYVRRKVAESANGKAEPAEPAPVKRPKADAGAEAARFSARQERARKWTQKILAEHGGSMPRGKLIELAGATDISERSVENALVALHVKVSNEMIAGERATMLRA